MRIYLLGSLTLVFACCASAVAQSSKVSAAVHEELAASPSGTVYVIVMLRPVSMRPRDQLADQMREVSNRQSRVLSALTPSEFNLVYRYRTFAGFTGRANLVGILKLAAHADVRSIGVDAEGQANLNDSVPFIGADRAQDFGFTGQGITVAVLDTGIDTNHLDLSDNLAAGAWHFLNQGATTGAGAEDDHGHGTNVSGIITSKGIVSSVGVAPDADILAVKVLLANNTGWLSDWTAGVDYVTSVVNNYGNLSVINMSLGSFALFGACPCDNLGSINQAFQAAILAAKNAGIVSFAASANNGSCTQMASPACLSAAVAVAAVYDQDLGPTNFGFCSDVSTNGDLITCFSNRNGCNELAAPGYRITAPGMGGGLSTFSGTSQASPHCAGVAALLCEAATLSPDAVVLTMKATGVATVDPCSTSPNPIRVDALAAVQSVTTTIPSLATGSVCLLGVLLLGLGLFHLRRQLP